MLNKMSAKTSTGHKQVNFNTDKNNQQSTGIKTKDKSKKWSRLVCNSEDELQNKNVWPTLYENNCKETKLDKLSTSQRSSQQRDNDGRKKSFIDALKSPSSTEQPFNCYEFPKVVPLNNKYAEQQGQLVTDKQENKQLKQEYLLTEDSIFQEGKRLEKFKSKQPFNDEDEEPWEIIKSKKKSNPRKLKTDLSSDKVPTKVNKRKDDENKTKVESKKKSTEVKNESQKESAEAKKMRKIALFKEKQRRRQEQILKDREAARSDTKVNLVSQNMIDNLNSSPTKKAKKNKSENFKFHLNEYPDLEANLNNTTTIIKQTHDIPIVRQGKKKIKSKINDAIEDTLESVDIVSYSKAVSAVQNVNLIQTQRKPKPKPKPKPKVNKAKTESSQKSNTRSPMKLDISSLLQKKIPSIKSSVKDSQSKSAQSRLASSSKTIKSTSPIKLHRGKNREVKKDVVSRLNKHRMREKKRRAESFLTILNLMKKEADLKLNNEQLEMHEVTKICSSSTVLPTNHITNTSTTSIDTTNNSIGYTENLDSELDITALDTTGNINSPALESTLSTTSCSDANISITSDDQNDATINDNITEKFRELTLEVAELQNTVHSRKFREYCNHCITPEINKTLVELIQELVRFQTRMFQKDPKKASSKRRYYCGLKETYKQMNKLSCIIVVPSLQRGKGPGGLDEKVQKVLDHAHEKGIPIIFGLSSTKIGRLCMKKIVSCLGIANYQGAQDKFNHLMELIPEAKQKYEALVMRGDIALPTNENEDINDENQLGDRLQI